jgi:uroporphyrinogen III methyltransferase/synthase
MGVFLVGAGPGDPGLITWRGRLLLTRADAVVHDRLVDRELLQLVPENALVVDVGKGREESAKQAEINSLLVDLGRRYDRVVRLKGGDPFVFGRALEEITALAEAGVPYRVVPGVSAAIAVPASAGVAVTYRGAAHGFSVVSAMPSGLLSRLEPTDLTHVFMMASVTLSEIASFLTKTGFSPETPVVAISWGSTWRESVAATKLSKLAGLSLPPPLTVVAGGAVANRFAPCSGGLGGARVALVRAKRNEELEQILWEHNANPRTFRTAVTREAPCRDDLVAKLRSQAKGWVVFTSSEAVSRFFAIVEDARLLAGWKVAAVGQETAEAVRSRFVRPDLVGDATGSLALSRLVSQHLRAGETVLHPSAQAADEALASGVLAARGRYEKVVLYTTDAVPLKRGDIEELELADVYVVFSPSAGRACIEQSTALCSGKPVLAIGARTHAALEAAGVSELYLAESARPADLVAALRRIAGDKHAGASG